MVLPILGKVLHPVEPVRTEAGCVETISLIDVQPNGHCSHRGTPSAVNGSARNHALGASLQTRRRKGK
jgi:hypothetical protein